jgi:hypothetical protein
MPGASSVLSQHTTPAVHPRHRYCSHHQTPGPGAAYTPLDAARPRAPSPGQRPLDPRSAASPSRAVHAAHAAAVAQPQRRQQLLPALRLLVEDVGHGLHQHACAAQLLQRLDRAIELLLGHAAAGWRGQQGVPGCVPGCVPEGRGRGQPRSRPGQVGRAGQAARGWARQRLLRCCSHSGRVELGRHCRAVGAAVVDGADGGPLQALRVRGGQGGPGRVGAWRQSAPSLSGAAQRTTGQAAGAAGAASPAARQPSSPAVPPGRAGKRPQPPSSAGAPAARARRAARRRPPLAWRRACWRSHCSTGQP